jgi:hypothetical protein
MFANPTINLNVLRNSKVEEEYCWAMTEAEGLSRSSVTELGFQLDFLTHAYTVDRRSTQNRLEQTATFAVATAT